MAPRWGAALLAVLVCTATVAAAAGGTATATAANKQKSGVLPPNLTCFGEVTAAGDRTLAAAPGVMAC